MVAGLLCAEPPNFYQRATGGLRDVNIGSHYGAYSHHWEADIAAQKCLAQPLDGMEVSCKVGLLYPQTFLCAT